MAVVYQHRRKDTNDIFYIGIGKTRSRAYSLRYRNSHWERIVKLFGYEVDILFEGISWEDACNVEIGLISSYGRRDLKSGNLVNMTDGGQGNQNILTTNETKKKLSSSALGKRKNCRKVIDNKTNIIYDCCKDSAKALGYNYNTFNCWMNGQLKNKSTCEYI